MLNELETSFDIEISSGENGDIIIKAIVLEKEFLYKFLVGQEGIWRKIQDYSEDSICKWIPEKEGKYTIMVQIKSKNSKKPFDYMTKEDILISSKQEVKLIKEINVNKSELLIGEKVEIEVIPNEENLLYRFWMKVKDSWKPIRDYTSQPKIRLALNSEGTKEILIECKKYNSINSFDEYKTLLINVKKPLQVKIEDFKCLTKSFLVNDELVFKIETNLDKKRSLLYKFIRIDEDGKTLCLQDFSSRRVISFQESKAGKYQLLCLVKDILSNQEYDDRAAINYEIEPYEKIEINNFKTDVESPQLAGSVVNLISDVKGGRQLVYRYLIEGTNAIDTGFIREDSYAWNTRVEGKYKITLFVKDISFEGEYEDKRELNFVLDRKSDKPARIKNIVKTNNSKEELVGRPINFKVLAEGGTEIKYAFIVYKDNVETERIEYGNTNWVNFIPEEAGDYILEIRVKDKYSIKEYDSNVFLKIRAKDYIPAEIEQVLFQAKPNYVVGDEFIFEVITTNTKMVRMRYVTKINGRVLEDTGYIKDKKVRVNFKRSGKYTFEIYAKNINSTEEFDSKKEINLYVEDNLPVTDTEIKIENSIIKVNNEVTFSVRSSGGRDVCYEFYVMEAGDWIKVQEYSKKNYYTFIPFTKGSYKIMVTAKSFYKNVNYEDYDEISFEVV